MAKINSYLNLNGNTEEAFNFYKTVFGWEFVKDTAVPIDYWQIRTDTINGGLLKRPAKRPGPAFPGASSS